MNFELIDDFKKRFPKYWSVWLAFLSMLSSVLEVVNAFGVVLPAFEATLPPGTFSMLSAVFAVCGIVARAIKQKSLSGGEDVKAG